MKHYTFREDDLQPFAKSSCKKCLGTGRTGYINGVAQVCTCVKKSLWRVQSKAVTARNELHKEGLL